MWRAHVLNPFNKPSGSVIFSLSIRMTKKPQALSYVVAKAIQDNIIIPGEMFHGHEFHYSKLELEGQKPKFAFDILRGRSD